MAARKTAKRQRRKPARPAKARRQPARRPKTARRPRGAHARSARKTASTRRKTAPAPRRKVKAVARTRSSSPPARPTARPAPRSRPPKAEPPRLERERRLLPDAERLDPTRGMTDERMLSAARTGHEELKAALSRHTATSPKLTAGDVDANWEDAYAVGDEAPGGDNPTPDQDRVDDIGKALGISYQDDEELKGAEKVAERDRHRWELDPASSEDWPHDKKD